VSTITDAKTLVEVGGGWIGHHAATLLRVVRGPVAFVQTLDFDAPPVSDAALFAVFISLVNLVLQIPLFRTLGVAVESTAYVLVDTVMTFAFWFIQAVILHSVARLFGVRQRSFQATLVCFLYLTAFMPIVMVISAPFVLSARRWMIEDGDVAGLLQGDVAMKLLAGSPAIAASAAGMIIFGLCLIGVYAAVFRAAYRIGLTRSLAIIFVSVGVYFAWSAAIEAPVQQMVFRAFHGRTS
jgi:hypothetical protein